MKIDGKAIADTILSDLTAEVTRLSAQHKTPTLSVVLVGDNPASLAYITQKQKAAEKIGAKILLNRQPPDIDPKMLQEIIQKINADPSVHGLIVQRPLPEALGNVSKILDLIMPGKDVDGFLPMSPFAPPVALAVLRMLQYAWEQGPAAERVDFDAWLRSRCSVVIGAGETAGAPIAKLLSQKGCTIGIVRSQTPNREELLAKADIVVSCVGKERVVTGKLLKPGAIVIGVGIWRDKNGKLRGDYDEDDIGRFAYFYTPTPGGVGPVNVACLMQNLVRACTMNG